jgi:hypothetical protein
MYRYFFHKNNFTLSGGLSLGKSLIYGKTNRRDTIFCRVADFSENVANYFFIKQINIYYYDYCRKT